MLRTASDPRGRWKLRCRICIFASSLSLTGASLADEPQKPIGQNKIPPSILNMAFCTPVNPTFNTQFISRFPLSGSVRLRFDVDKDGTVVTGEVTQSSGHKKLDEAALEALGRCPFRPGTIDGKPVRAWGPIVYTFRLPDGY